MSEWLAMGGYGAYVWGAYAASLVILAWDATAPARARRQLRKRRPPRPSRNASPP